VSASYIVLLGGPEMAEAGSATTAPSAPVPERRKRERLGRALNSWPRGLTAISVAYFSLVGLAARVGLALLLEGQNFGVTTTQPGLLGIGTHQCWLKNGGSGYFVQNILGCILMAAIARHKTHMNEHLAVGLASGLCGSLTTFATWMGEEAATILNSDTFAAIISLICMLCVSLCSYRLGHFIAGCGMGEEPRCFDDFCGLRTVARCLFQRTMPRKDASEWDIEKGPVSAVSYGRMTSVRSGPRDQGTGRSPEEEAEVEREREEEVDSLDWGLAMDDAKSWHDALPAQPIRLSPVVEWFIVLLALLVIVAYVILCSVFEYYEGLFALAYAPLGALLRWSLSLHNAPAQKACLGLPVFTLVANTLGCVCNALAAFYSPQEPSHLGHIAVAAISTGFAGCLSTVSTLIGELRSDTLGGLRVRIFYFLISFGLAMAVELPFKSARCAQ